MARRMSALARAGSAVSGWWFKPMPLARVAVLRTLVYLFLIFDMLYVATDVVPHGYVPELYQPTLVARILQLPTLGVTGGQVLFWVVTLASVCAAIGAFQRAAGWVAGLGFWLWMLNSQGFSYVSHDHMALMVAVLVLPTVGVARFGDTGSSERVGWVLRVVQVFTILTYFGSAISKWTRSGTPWVWANGAVFVWAIMRRGSDLIRWTLDFPWLLIVGQWALLLLEFCSPVVLFLRGKWLYALVATFVLFHLATYLALGIHFLPTVVCWAAFLPLERIPAWLRRRIGRRSEVAPA
ncbi:hypothetical protein [Pseudactinotalea sp. HY158]|uniref:hypothetical protein n=1 Tax=Pseudactinotalea sp. HY158 TaxID=2654547 RepID=UPI00129C80AD|nr:hypothetical protein [Pseudactinotalea sp. HY158]QGH68453.1 hypothetical protein GCE65_02220 [Pseudactinotalea sp. HY158]